jgi:hypothetical protein
VITLPRTVRVWAYGRPVDLRKGYNGLVGIVENELRSDPMGGELYLFVNAKRTEHVERAGALHRRLRARRQENALAARSKAE